MHRHQKEGAEQIVHALDVWWGGMPYWPYVKYALHGTLNLFLLEERHISICSRKIYLNLSVVVIYSVGELSEEDVKIGEMRIRRWLTQLHFEGIAWKDVIHTVKFLLLVLFYRIQIHRRTWELNRDTPSSCEILHVLAGYHVIEVIRYECVRIFKIGHAGWI